MYNFSWELAALLKLARLQFIFVLSKVIMLKWKLLFLSRSDHKSDFSLKKKVSMIIVLTWIIPPLVTIITFPLHGLAPNMIFKKIFPQWFELFKIKIPYLLCWKDTMIHLQFWAVSVKAFVRTSKLKTTDMECKSILKR